MAKLPEPAHTTAALIYKTYEDRADSGMRPHLGASLIGHPCERFLWYTFRWVYAKKHSGRMLRLFETGQLQEARLVADLRAIGAEVHDSAPDGRQWRVEACGGHFAGSMDGAAVGLPEAPKAWHVLEFKTHNDKSFSDLLKNGVQKSKPQHYAQMQTYMGLTGMERAMYMAVNKNDDTIYTERVDFDQVEFVRLKARAERVIGANEPPLRVSNDPSWFVCKMCDFHEHCHGVAVPNVNCRTCAHSTPEVTGDARWSCPVVNEDLNISSIPMDLQRTGCKSHRFIPILLERFATFNDYVNGDVVYESATGRFANGEGEGALSSEEIKALESPDSAGLAAELKGKVAAMGIDSKVVA